MSTYEPSAEAVEAAARALHERGLEGHPALLAKDARVVLDAALPIIEAEVREQLNAKSFCSSCGNYHLVITQSACVELDELRQEIDELSRENERLREQLNAVDAEPRWRH